MAAGASRQGARSARWRSVLRIGILVVLATGLATGACTRRNGPGPDDPASWVLQPEEAHYGASYAEWSARWWQWAYELPRTNHPLFDTVGTDAARGQIDPVWFIGGIFTPNYVPLTGTAERTITIPSGIALFFPIVNSSWDNEECVEPDTNFSFTELREMARNVVENVQDLHCSIDGVEVLNAPDLASGFRFRAQAPEFSTAIPADNIFVDLCGDAPVPVVYDPVAADGIYMMIGPMPAGGHTVTFSGTFPVPAYFHIEITYHITVLP